MGSPELAMAPWVMAFSEILDGEYALFSAEHLFSLCLMTNSLSFWASSHVAWVGGEVVLMGGDQEEGSRAADCRGRMGRRG